MASTSSQASTSTVDTDFDFSEELLGKLPDLLSDLQIEYCNLQFLAGGNFSLVFSFDILSEGVTTPAVIRISAEDSKERRDATINLVAILDFLKNHFTYTPKVLRYDASSENVIQLPYTIQTRRPGQTLESIWSVLSLEAKCNITRDIADFLMDCEAIRFPSYGHLINQFDSNSQNPSIKLGFEPLGEEAKAAFTEHATQRMSLGTLCQQTIALQVEDSNTWEDDGEDVDINRGLLKGIAEIVDEMQHEEPFRNYFSENINDAVLHHGDLHDGNILVEKSGPGEDDWHLSGIIDWDAAFALPLVLAREPANTLWYGKIWHDNAVLDIWNENFVHLPRSCRAEFDEPHGRQVKECFDLHTIKKRSEDSQFDKGQWMEDVYGAGEWIRRVADFSFHGFNDEPEKIPIATEILEEWEEYMEPQICLPSPSVWKNIGTFAMFAGVGVLCWYLNKACT